MTQLSNDSNASDNSPVEKTTSFGVNPMKQPTFKKSLSHAWDGLLFTIHTQRNAKIHLVIGALIAAMGVWLKIDSVRWSILFLTIGAVLAAETVNTTVEAIVDLLSPEWHDRAKDAKDVAAAAVLIMSLTAIAVGLAVLGPPLWMKLTG